MRSRDIRRPRFETPAYITPQSTPAVGVMPTIATPHCLVAEHHAIEVPEAVLEAAGLIDTHQCNPSVCVFDSEHLLVSIRVVDKSLRTTTFLGTVTQDDWTLADIRPMRDLTGERSATHTGYEDVRIFYRPGRGFYASANIVNLSPHDPRSKMAVLDLDNDGNVIDVHVQPSNRLEKNWMPLVDGHDLRFIYGLKPTTIVTRYSDELHACLPAAADLPLANGSLRGGSQVIPYDDGDAAYGQRSDHYLCVAHQVHEGRVYTHRLVLLDKFLQVERMSKPFVFSVAPRVTKPDDAPWMASGGRRDPIEFCAGLCEWEGKFVLSYGIGDKSSYLAIVDPETVREMLAKPSISVADTRRVFVVHSPNERCGVREYGLQLDRVFVEDPRVALTSSTFHNLPTTVQTLSAGDVLFVHFEPSLVPNTLKQSLADAKSRGATIVFCCHWFENAVSVNYEGLVDTFVVHRSYDGDGGKRALIHLGCPTYEPAETRDAIRERLGMPKYKTVVTTLGFLSTWKKFPEVTEAFLAAMSERKNEDVMLYIQTPWPFRGEYGATYEEGRMKNVLARYPELVSRVHFSTTFLSERDLLDLVHASDLGFVYHATDTGSVSAAAKQYVSARCPVVVTASNHVSDLMAGVERVATNDANIFVEEVLRVAVDPVRREVLRAEMASEYERINMRQVGKEYIDLFMNPLSADEGDVERLGK